jgi:hypothetical protein
LYKACFRFNIISFTNTKQEKKADDPEEIAAEPAELLEEPKLSDYRDKTHQFD